MIKVMSPNQVLCLFLLICFNEEIGNEFCAKGCKCYNAPKKEISAICENNVRTLDSEFSSNKPINSLAFVNINNEINFALLFPNRQIVRNLIIQNSQNNFWSTKGNNLFRYIEETQYITLKEVYFAGWEWDIIAKNLNSLEAIHFEDCTFEKVISEKMSKISTNKVRILTIIKSKFEKIEAQALSWPNLKKISITGHKVFLEDEKSEFMLRRDWFSSNLNNLWSLDLRSNKIKVIPEGFFDRMPKLRTLKLSNNEINTITWNIISPVWSSLNEFWISNNLIECTKDLVWITKQVKYPLFFGDGSCRFSGLKEQTPMEFYRANSPPDVDPLASQNTIK